MLYDTAICFSNLDTHILGIILDFKRQVGEKARERGHKVYMAFLDLEKAYDEQRESLWKVL